MRARPLSSPAHDRNAQGQRSATFLATAGAALALLLAGCTSLPLQATDALPGYGSSVNQNAAVMIIDPQPARALDTALPLDGHRAEIAIIRYYTNQVVPPESLATSGLGGTSSNAAPGAAVATPSGAMQ